jgi:uncharacterized protein (TIGR03000 family)
MFRQWVPYLATPAVALAAFLAVADTAAAQQFGRRGGSAFRNSPWSGGGSGYYSPYGNAYGWDSQSDGSYQSQYPQSYGNGYNSPQYSTQGYFNNRRSLPRGYGYGSDFYPRDISGAYGDQRLMTAYETQDPNAVLINVRVPVTAEIWLDGEKTTQTGERRQYVSPPLNAGQVYTYEVRAKWTENGQPVDQTRKVRFQAGASVTLNFMTPPSRGANATGHHEDSRFVPARTEESQQSAPRDQYLRRPSAIQAEAVKTLNPDDSLRQSENRTHDGKMVSLAADKLVMTGGLDDKEHSHALGAGVKITCDGKACQREDLRSGMKLRVTTKQDDQQTVTRIDALDQQNDFEKRAK